MSGTVKGVYLCRLCGRNSQNYLEIFSDEGVRRKLSTKVQSCLQISVHANDVLPTIACIQCCTKLDESWDFYQRSAKAQIILQNIFEPVDDFHNNDGLFEILVSKQDILVTKDDCVDNKTIKINNDVDNQDEDNVNNPDIIMSSQNFIVSKVRTLSNEEHINIEDKLETVINTNDMEHDDSTDHNYGVAENSVNEDKKNIRVFNHRRSGNRPENMKGYLWSCTICESGIIETHQEYCRHYKNVHNVEPIYKCTTCGKVYEKYRSFARHISMHQSSGQIKCNECGKEFTMKSSLISHAAVHSNERPFKCDTCDRSFKRSSTLLLHIKSHDPDNADIFSCNHCEKTFKVKRSWQTHEKMHKGERDFTCDICGKSFVTRSSLIYHISSHEEEKNYECTICNQKYRTSRLLKRHASTHLDIKPYRCETCGREFREKSSLKSHSRIHTGVMPYSCDICGKRFRFIGILTVHKRQHTGEKPYHCNNCNKSFTNWPNYNKHMKRIHKRDTGNPERKKQYKSANSTKIEEVYVVEEMIDNIVS
ncbi:hypothetical protein HCN44_009289 [Aphidius gifuensis]|uniref:Uncharacterized protein n=1 Tax=Aphidius gifuensis TaxID=684658 RepID=A0A834Y7B1_APHGI|nr:zinc finger protein OZF-like [Aphidius gifuensis]KAF7997891.1 hypothetical protein HCN44_009289 [Aphidius gifuensis]